jgi:hypothetical protein
MSPSFAHYLRTMRPYLVVAFAIGCAAHRAAPHSAHPDDATMFVFDHACDDPHAAATLVLSNDRVADVALAGAHDRGDYTPDTLVAQICESLVHGNPELKIVGAVVVGPAGSDQGIRPDVVSQRVHFVMQDNEGERSEFSHDVVWVQTHDGWRLAWIE